MPKVSVIVPVYKVEKYLHRCVDSILAQTFRDFELILVDDGSPDGCGAICDEYAAKDSRVKVIHQENRGVSAARNAGLDVACGEYIAFVDSDDYIDRDFLEALVSCAEVTNADVVVTNYKIENPQGEPIHSCQHVTGSERLESADERMQYLVRGILGGQYGWEVYTRLFKRRIIEECAIRFCTTCGNYAEDLGFVLQYSLFIKSCSSIEYCGYNYFIRQDSMMRCSAGLVKLDQVNEVSKYVEEAFHRALPTFGKQFALIHFLIMRVEYQKMIGTTQYCKLPEEIKKVKNYSWWRKQTTGIWYCRREAELFYGKRVARQILLLSHFCCHGNWRRFELESAIAYKWFIK